MQFDENKQAKVAEVLEACAWGDIHSDLVTMADALERALKASEPFLVLWEAEGEGEARYIDEFSVSEDDLEVMSLEWRLAYVSRLLLSFRLVFGSLGTGPDLVPSTSRSPAGVLRALDVLAHGGEVA
jgi:hypothetical protein